MYIVQCVTAVSGLWQIVVPRQVLGAVSVSECCHIF